jgi:hypothetical protein
MCFSLYETFTKGLTKVCAARGRNFDGCELDEPVKKLAEAVPHFTEEGEWSGKEVNHSIDGLKVPVVRVGML